MRLTFKKGVLLERSGSANPHQLALKARVSSPTIGKFINAPETVLVIDAAVLAAIVTEGFGLTKRQALDLRLGDLFEFTE